MCSEKMVTEQAQFDCSRALHPRWEEIPAYDNTHINENILKILHPTATLSVEVQRRCRRIPDNNPKFEASMSSNRSKQDEAN